mgnify:CR=1 FL=1
MKITNEILKDLIKEEIQEAAMLRKAMGTAGRMARDIVRGDDADLGAMVNDLEERVADLEETIEALMRRGPQNY